MPTDSDDPTSKTSVGASHAQRGGQGAPNTSGEALEGHPGLATLPGAELGDGWVMGVLMSQGVCDLSRFVGGVYNFNNSL